MSLRVHALARDPAVLSLLEHPNIGVEARPLGDLHVAGFDSVNVFAIDGSYRAALARCGAGAGPGTSRARTCSLRPSAWPSSADNEQSELHAPGLEVCVAKLIRSHLDGQVKLGLSAPLFDGERLVGVAEASTMARIAERCR